MAVCRCGASCGCEFEVGEGLILTGTGEPGDPWVLSLEEPPPEPDEVVVPFTTQADWDRFIRRGVTNQCSVVDELTITPDGGNITTSGPNAPGSDRRVYVLEEFGTADDIEAYVSLTANDDTIGQLGVALRWQPEVAVMPWYNIVFGGNASTLRGVWEWDPPGCGSSLFTNQHEPAQRAIGGPITGATGDGTTVTVTTATPHYLSDIAPLAVLVTFGPFSQTPQNDYTVVDPNTFSFPSTEVGPWGSGSWEVAGTALAVGVCRNYGLRVVGNQLTIKHWFCVEAEGEPPWSDPWRASTAPLPLNLDGGHAVPSEGQVGIEFSHLTDGGTTGVRSITVHEFIARRL